MKYSKSEIGIYKFKYYKYTVADKKDGVTRYSYKIGFGTDF